MTTARWHKPEQRGAAGGGGRIPARQSLPTSGPERLDPPQRERHAKRSEPLPAPVTELWVGKQQLGETSEAAGTKSREARRRKHGGAPPSAAELLRKFPTVTCAGWEEKRPEQSVDQLLHGHRAPAAVAGREDDRSGLRAAPAPRLTPAGASRGGRSGWGGGADLPAPRARGAESFTWSLERLINMKRA